VVSTTDSGVEGGEDMRDEVSELAVSQELRTIIDDGGEPFIMFTPAPTVL
jgi:hypothetical protein